MQSFSYHCHTTFSDGMNTVEEMILGAKKKGFTHLGISDHLTVLKTSDFKVKLPAYQAHAQHIRSVAKKMNFPVYVGFETDYFPQKGWHKALQEFKKAVKADYLLTGNHFVIDNDGIPHPILQFPWKEKSIEEINIIISRHFRIIAQAVRSGLFDFLAHPDFIRWTSPCGEIDFWEERMDIIEALSETQTPVELNTKGLEKICDFQKNKSKKKTDPFIMHVQSVKMKDGERFYYGRSMYDVEPIKNGIYTLYPSQKKITVVDVPVIGCIKIKEQVDIVRGDCISDIKLIKSSVISHKTIWFDKPVSEIYLKHGTNIVKIDRYTDNIMELNHPICFNNINDFSKNGFGVIIDWSTKKTIGCSVFLTNDLNQSIEGKTQKHGFVFWFTGLSGAGKTTLSRELLKQFSVKPIVLDADDIRAGLSSDLGFSPNDCLKNVDRIAHVAKLISEQGHNVIVTCISKFKEQRQRIKELIGDNYIEIFVNRSLEECHKNDAKGLYHALGRNNVIQNYEIGNSAFMTINTNKDTVEQSTNKMLKQLKKAKII